MTGLRKISFGLRGHRYGGSEFFDNLALPEAVSHSHGTHRERVLSPSMLNSMGANDVLVDFATRRGRANLLDRFV
jgi:hypothetical protein